MKLNTVFLAAIACALVSARAVPQEPAVGAPAVVEPAVVEPAVVTPADPLNTGGAQVDPAASEPRADVAAADVPADGADAAAPAAAQNVFTSPTGGNLDGGAPITITWTPGNPDSMVSIALILGPEGAMQEVEKIAVAQTNSGSYTWDAPKKLQDSTTITNGDQYGLQIIDDTTGEGSFSAPFSLSVPDSTFGTPEADEKEEEETVSSSAVESSSSAAPTSTEASSSSSSSSAESSSATPTSTSKTESSASATPTSSAKPKETDADEDEPTKSTTTDDAASSPTETDDPNNTPLPSSSGPPIGPIVGGVFGGFAALAFLVVGGLYLSRRMRKEKTKREMRTSGFLRNMEAVDREHAEYMKQHGSVKETPAAKYERTQGMSNAF